MNLPWRFRLNPSTTFHDWNTLPLGLSNSADAVMSLNDLPAASDVKLCVMVTWSLNFWRVPLSLGRVCQRSCFFDNCPQTNPIGLLAFCVCGLSVFSGRGTSDQRSNFGQIWERRTSILLQCKVISPVMLLHCYFARIWWSCLFSNVSVIPLLMFCCVYYYWAILLHTGVTSVPWVYILHYRCPETH